MVPILYFFLHQTSLEWISHGMSRTLLARRTLSKPKVFPSQKIPHGSNDDKTQSSCWLFATFFIKKGKMKD